MNGLLAIAGAFLDLMTNPGHGRHVNDEYALRFAQVLAEDTGFAGELAAIPLTPDDVGSLPMCAWPWYLQWRTTNGTLPSPEFLDALFDATEDPGVRLGVVQSAVADAARDNRPELGPWLRSRAGRAAERADGEADEIAAYLLQLGDEASIAGLRLLLGTPSHGQDNLIAVVQEHLDEAGLDPATRSAWNQRLGIADEDEEPGGPADR